MSRQILQSNKRALSKVIKEVVKDGNPEPFKGYQEISNATQHTKKTNKKPINNNLSVSDANIGDSLQEESTIILESASVDLNEMLNLNQS